MGEDQSSLGINKHALIGLILFIIGMAITIVIMLVGSADTEGGALILFLLAIIATIFLFVGGALQGLATRDASSGSGEVEHATMEASNLTEIPADSAHPKE